MLISSPIPSSSSSSSSSSKVDVKQRNGIPLSETYNSLSEIVGEETLFGKLMQAGSILDMIDVLAGKISHQFCHASGAHSVTTLAFDRVDLLHPIHHGDLILLEGRVILAGKSSMVIEIQGFRQDMLSRTFIPVQSCHVIMVAINKDGRPFRNIPKLIYDTPEEEAAAERYRKRQQLTNSWLKAQEEAENRFKTIPPPSASASSSSSSSSSPLTQTEVEEEEEEEEGEDNDKVSRRTQGLPYQELLTVSETKITVRRTFFPRHTNVNNTIFGGDILLWMDRCATHTARSFTRNRNVFTISMNRVFFKHPIYISDWVEMTARVVNVRMFTLEVEIEVTLERHQGGKERKRIASHSGYFTVLNCDEAGFRRPILTGLKAITSSSTGTSESEAREDALRLLRAKARYHFFRKYEASPSTAALHGVSLSLRHASGIGPTTLPFFEWKGAPHTFHPKLKAYL